MRKLAAVTTLIAMVNLLIGCASSGGAGLPLSPLAGPTEAVQAHLFPELKLITTEGNSYRGKLIRLQGDDVALRPYPYWQIPEIQIPLMAIHQIEMGNSESHAGNGFVTGFSVLFLPLGAIFGASSKYNSDFSASLLASGLIGLVGGLVGLVVGAVVDATKTTKIKFYELSGPQKRSAILKIMGRVESRL